MLHIPAPNEPSEILAVGVERSVARRRYRFGVRRQRERAPDCSESCDHQGIAASLFGHCGSSSSATANVQWVEGEAFELRRRARGRALAAELAKLAKPQAHGDALH